MKLNDRTILFYRRIDRNISVLLSRIVSFEFTEKNMTTERRLCPLRFRRSTVQKSLEKLG